MLGNQIRARRQWKKLTLKELSTLTGVPAGRISEYENDRRDPSIETLDGLSAVLGPFTVGAAMYPSILNLKWRIQANPDDYENAAELALVREVTLPTEPRTNMLFGEDHEVRYIPAFRRVELLAERVIWNLEGYFEVHLQPFDIPWNMNLADAVVEWVHWETWKPSEQLRPDTHNLAPLKNRHDPQLDGYSAVMQWIKGR